MFCTNYFNVILLLLGGACKIARYSFGGAEQPQMIALLLYNLCLVWGTAGPKEDTFLFFITTRPYHTGWLTKSNSTGKSSIVNWSACLYNTLYLQLIKPHQAARNLQHS